MSRVVDGLRRLLHILWEAWTAFVVFAAAPGLALYAVYADGWFSKVAVAVLAFGVWAVMVVDWARERFSGEEAARRH